MKPSLRISFETVVPPSWSSSSNVVIAEGNPEYLHNTLALPILEKTKGGANGTLILYGFQNMLETVLSKTQQKGLLVEILNETLSENHHECTLSSVTILKGGCACDDIKAKSTAWKTSHGSLVILGATAVRLNNQKSVKPLIKLLSMQWEKQQATQDRQELARVIRVWTSTKDVSNRGTFTVLLVNANESRNQTLLALHAALTDVQFLSIFVPLQNREHSMQLLRHITKEDVASILSKQGGTVSPQGIKPNTAANAVNYDNSVEHLKTENEQLRIALAQKESDLLNLRSAFHALMQSVERCGLSAQERIEVLEAARMYISAENENEFKETTDRVVNELEQNEFLNGVYRVLDNLEEKLQNIQTCTVDFVSHPASYPQPSLAEMQLVEVTLYETKSQLEKTPFTKAEDIRAKDEGLNVIKNMILDIQSYRNSVSATVKASCVKRQDSWCCPVCSQIFAVFTSAQRKEHINSHFQEQA